MECPIARSLDVVGEWWTPLILRNVLMGGMTRFEEIQSNLGIGPTVLTNRLNRLVERGLLERRQYSDRPPRFDYVATEAARDFLPVLDALYAWGDKWAPPTPQ